MLTRRKLLWSAAGAFALGACGYKLVRGFDDGGYDVLGERLVTLGSHTN